LRTLSGFGWDHARSMVIATDQVWEAYLQVSVNYSYLLIFLILFVIRDIRKLALFAKALSLIMMILLLWSGTVPPRE
ncbi:hypothetical protein EV360DRAFT_57958, partial [Lentinula raphanica]